MNVNVGDLVVCEYEYEGLLPEVYKNVGYVLSVKNGLITIKWFYNVKNKHPDKWTYVSPLTFFGEERCNIHYPVKK